MADVHTLIDRNHEFARSFDQGDLPILPSLRMLIVTCLDARVDPARYFGLELGEAFVVRNIGGRVTDETIQQIAILIALAGLAGGGSIEVAIVHHTDCGALRFADPQVRQKLAEASGAGVEAIERLAASDPHVSVAEDVDRLREAPNLPHALVVSGYVYDIASGQVREVVEPSASRMA